MAGLSADKLEAPVLFFHGGIQGTTPPGFDEQLAGEFHAQYISKADVQSGVRRELGMRDRDDLPRWQIYDGMIDRVVDQVAAGEDVVLGMAFNTARSRARVPLEVANRVLAVTVALDIVTPLSVIEDRVHEMAAAQPANGVRRRHGAPIASLDMATHGRMQRPRLLEPGLDLILELDGGQNTQGMFDQISAFLAENGIHYDKVNTEA